METMLGSPPASLTASAASASRLVPGEWRMRTGGAATAFSFGLFSQGLLS